MIYNFVEIEKKWQEIWEKNNAFAAENDYSKPKYYALVEFPYPSGQGLHVGHPRSYTALDIVSRKRRLEGYNVLYPMGWDAFGLPTENFAIKNNIHPEIVTQKNISNFKRQLMSLGISFDWNREINTTNKEYYKWTQWIFIKLFKNGLAYKKEMSVNWCNSCKVVLANEEVVNNGCERCGGEVVRKDKSQWMLKITQYADSLIDDLSDVDYIERVKVSQKNWIGRSNGAEIYFFTNINRDINVYTTRPDIIYGVTHLVIAPEHPLINEYSDKIKNIAEVKEYKLKSSKKSDFERTEIVKEKTGVRLEGINAINPLNGKEIPIFISDYVLMGYGTGAIMSVPAHDERDYDFAKIFNIDIIEVISKDNILINSDIINGLSVDDAKEKIINWLEDNKKGSRKTNYKLRDWVFSRQRYWGEPIPIVYCDDCGYVPLDEKDLPLVLPDVKVFEPTSDGESPLSNIESFVNTKCPCCGKDAKRETDTMPQWAGSSWYFLRYCDANNKDILASKEALDYWLPVDWYNGGMEHTTLHLLYSRFWHKFLYDIGVVSCKEPYSKRTSHGMILGENSEKMSKSRGNVVNPDSIISEYGADTLRLYEMFIGDFEKSATWNSDSIKGCRRFLDRLWNLQSIIIDGESYRESIENIFHKTIKKVSLDIENLKFNTAIASMMTLINNIYNIGSINRFEYRTLLILLNPFAPHITEELYSLIGYNDFLYNQKWVIFDESKCNDDTIEIALQVNGKIKSKINIANNLDKSEVISIAKNDSKIKSEIGNKKIVKEIYVNNKLVNFVVK